MKPNLKNYDEAVKDFRWEDVEKNFSWSQTGKVNIVHEMIDRHSGLALIYWNKEEKKEERYTFEDLKLRSSNFANVLKKKYMIKKGDRVAIFLPRSPELYIAFLAILRIGAIPVPLFEAFMEEAVFDRLRDSGTVLIITQTAFLNRIPKYSLPELKYILIGLEVDSSSDCKPTWLDLDDGLVLHYTSGSTGRAKGVLHRQYAMVGHYQTTLWSLDLKPEDVYWCTADPGWVTGTSYGIFGPWLLGNPILVLGGRFSAPVWYEALEKFKVTVWYSAPTAYRMLMANGEELAKKYDLSSIRHICSVGEPLNPEALLFIKSITGVAPLETWWMTETGMHIVCNFRCTPLHIGATGKPFPGTYATVVDSEGNEVPPNTMGHLVVRPPWPSMMKAIWNNQAKFDEYFHPKGWYMSGDSAYKDHEGFIWFCGREDDVIKTQGERVGPFEVESALLEHPAVAESGVIGKPDELKGHIIKAYVALKPGFEPTEELKEEIKLVVKKKLSAFAAPKEIEFIEKIPQDTLRKNHEARLEGYGLRSPIRRHFYLRMICSCRSRSQKHGSLDRL